MCPTIAHVKKKQYFCTRKECIYVMKIVIIGAGSVGTNLHHAFELKGACMRSVARRGLKYTLAGSVIIVTPDSL